jgi:hypothetical protein
MPTPRAAARSISLDGGTPADDSRLDGLVRNLLAVAAKDEHGVRTRNLARLVIDEADDLRRRREVRPDAGPAATVLTDGLSDILAVAGMVAGADEHAVPNIVGVTVAIDGHIVEARATPEGWAFRRQRRAGRGRVAAVQPAQLARAYQSALGGFQKFRAALSKGDTSELIADSRWLRKIALYWKPSSLRIVPEWLRPHVEDLGDGDEIRLPIAAIDHFETIRAALNDDPIMLFESRPLDLTWNDFVRRRWQPANVAAKVVGIYFGGLSDSYIAKRKGRRASAKDRDVVRPNCISTNPASRVEG